MAGPPIRTCVSCGRKAPKKELIRVGKEPSGVVGVNWGGRGAYVCKDAQCVETAIRRKLLAKRLRVDASLVHWLKLSEELTAMVSKRNDAEV